MRLDAAIKYATERLSPGSESARLDAEIMLCRTIDMPRSYLFTHPGDELDELAIERFERLLARRLDGEPMAYIMGSKEFWSHDLYVGPATLVPRPETELLVDLALREIPRDARYRVLDLGTGSGAIAIAIASERTSCSVTATDISEAALAVARENVRAADLGNVECVQGSWIEPLGRKRFELIVCNPPYVCDNDAALDALRHEPLSALASGNDGLKDIRVLARDCGAVLTANGRLMLEHGAEQREAVETILQEHGWDDIACHNDLAGLPRVTVARRGGTQAPSTPTDESS